jgi:hypothetical protein
MRDTKTAVVIPWPEWHRLALAIAFAVVLAVGFGCKNAPPRKMIFTPVEPRTVERGLAGAWRARVNFRTGALAAIHDLEFMYVFNTGGTLTESSNYDSAPPVPPAYGVWHKLSMTEYEAKYTFFVTKPPGNFAEIAGGAGWLPTGHGVLTERITLSGDGNSYKSTITYEPVGMDGKTVEGGGEGDVSAVRMDF